MWLVPMKGLLLLVSLHTAMSSNITYTMASTTPAEFLNLTSTFLLSPSTSLPPDLTTTLVVAPNISSTSTPSPASTSAPNNATSTPSPASTSAPNNATSTPNPATNTPSPASTNTPSPASTNTPNISSSSTLSSTYSVTSSFITSPSVSTPVVASSSVTGVSSGSLTMSSPALQTKNTSTAMRTSLTSTPAASQLGDVPTTISGAISTPTPPTTATTTTTTTTTSQTIIIIAAAAGGGGLVLVLVLVICCVCCYCCLCRRQYEYATGNNPGYHVTVQQWKEDQAHYTANRSGSMSSRGSSNRGSFGVRFGRGSKGSKKSVRSRDGGDYTAENPGVFSTPL